MLTLALSRRFPSKLLHLDQQSTIDDTAAADIRRGSLWGLDALGTIGLEKSILTKLHRPPSFSFIKYNSISHLLRRQGIEWLPFPSSFLFPWVLSSLLVFPPLGPWSLVHAPRCFKSCFSLASSSPHNEDLLALLFVSPAAPFLALPT